jgi:hypothetical protein
VGANSPSAAQNKRIGWTLLWHPPYCLLFLAELAIDAMKNRCAQGFRIVIYMAGTCFYLSNETSAKLGIPVGLNWLYHEP